MNYLSEFPIDLAKELSFAHNEHAGAIVLFSGETRKSNNDKEVEYLEYEAHPLLADKEIQKIIDQCKSRWDLLYIKVLHRVGRVDILESAVVIITSSKHRKEAYESNSWIIDKLKHTVPIWKKEVYADGTQEWILQCNHGVAEFEHRH